MREMATNHPVPADRAFFTAEPQGNQYTRERSFMGVPVVRFSKILFSNQVVGGLEFVRARQKSSTYIMRACGEQIESRVSNQAAGRNFSTRAFP